MTRTKKGPGPALALLLGLAAALLLPAEALARRSMSFAPGARSRSHATHAHHATARHARNHGHNLRGAGRRSRTAVGAARMPVDGGDEGEASRAVPGKGFTLDHGVLTYPAPARFQPQNLKRR